MSSLVKLVIACSGEAVPPAFDRASLRGRLHARLQPPKRVNVRVNVRHGRQEGVTFTLTFTPVGASVPSNFDRASLRDRGVRQKRAPGAGQSTVERLRAVRSGQAGKEGHDGATDVSHWCEAALIPEITENVQRE